MRYKFHDIPRLITLPLGRHTVLKAIFLRLRIFLMPVARFYRRFFLRNTCFIAVIGSFGKTTTTRALQSVLLKKSPLHHNRNPESLVAMDILRTHTESEYAVFEAGIDKPGRMDKFAQMIRPDIVVVTSIGREHHTSFRTLENTRHEKAEMVRILPMTGVAILNADDPNVMWMKTQTHARVVTFGFNKDADIRCVSVNFKSLQQTRIGININDKNLELNTRLIGKVMIYPLLAAIAVAWVKEMDLSEIKPFLEAMAPTSGRLQPVVLKNGVIILRDDYKSPEETYKAAFDAFKKIPARRRIAVIGEIEELHGKSGLTYRWLGEQVAHISNEIIFIGGKKRLKPFRSGVRNSGFSNDPIIYAAKSIRQATEILKKLLKPDDLVLLKGSGSQKLERIILNLEGQSVRCELKECSVRFIECKNCPMLKRGWGDGRSVF